MIQTGTFALLQHTLARLPNLTILHIARHLEPPQTLSPYPFMSVGWHTFLFSFFIPSLRKLKLSMNHIEPVVAYSIISQHRELREVDIYACITTPTTHRHEYPESSFRIPSLERLAIPAEFLHDIPAVDHLSSIHLYGDVLCIHGHSIFRSLTFLNKLHDFRGLTSLSFQFKDLIQVVASTGTPFGALGNFVPHLKELEIRVGSCICDKADRVSPTCKMFETFWIAEQFLVARSRFTSIVSWTAS